MAGSCRGDSPPILTLLDAVEAHRGAFEYDWRTRFHIPFDVPASMGWGEAWRLFLILGSDPSTQVAAALAGWQHPASREELAIAWLFDLTGRLKLGRKHKPYPRPWDERPKQTGTGRRTVDGWHKFKERAQREYVRRRDG